MTIKFFWATDTGCDWLIELIECETTEAAIIAAEQYYSNTKESAEQLLEGWRRNGEIVSMWPNAESSETHTDAALWRFFDSV